MNLIEKLEKEKALNAKKERRASKLEELKAENNLVEAEKLDSELSELSLDIIKLENELKDVTEEGKKSMHQYAGSKKEVNDFVEILQSSPTAEKAANKWKAKLAENGITITDDENYLPKKIVESINTTLTETNPVFPLFRVTNVGALIVSQTFGSTDEALVHTPGATKQEQEASLELATLKPVMIYKLQSIHEYVRRTIGSIDEIISLLIAEMTQAIVNKIVDLALIEGDGTTNGFQSIANDTRVDFVKHIDAPETFVKGAEEAVNFVKRSNGNSYLIVTEEQRTQLLEEVRALQPQVRIKNDDTEIATEVGANGLIIYRGTKDIKPTLLSQDAFHVDMDSMTQIQAFKWETNENKFLLECVAGGHIDKMYGAADITLPSK